jgi:arylsulfatase A-like enzyme
MVGGMRLIGLFLGLLVALAATAAERPNFIIIFADDQGWADVGVYGSPNIRTPHLDRLAREGVKFTSFYAAPFCGPSRAALMTGCYPPRVSLAFNHGPRSKTGIHPDEVTIAEVLQGAGYATKMIGKWHLGSLPEFRPHRNGFDEWFGLPYSNDMWRYHPKMPPRPDENERMRAARERAAYTGYAGSESYYSPDGGFPEPLPLMRNDEVLEEDPDQTKLTRTYTELALDFIEREKDGPFFLYIPHAMPHVPLFRSEEFAGRSFRGLYGDVIEEIDSSVGRILAKLEELGIDDETLVFYTSDNGPWLQYGVDGGSAGPFNRGKGTTWEGGMRVPGIARWPGRIPAALVTHEIAANMDLLPTFAKLAGAELPADRALDGRDIWPLMSQPGARSPHEFFYFYGGRALSNGPNLRAVRDRRWKLHYQRDGAAGELFDLGEDPGEKFDRSGAFPEIVERLAARGKEFNAGLTAEVRPLGGAEE